MARCHYCKLGLRASSSTFTITLLVLVLGCSCVVAQVHPYFPALFLFGDSLIDTGNNNKLTTFAKANRLPYGKDFINHLPTGRFCNGPLSTDFIARLAGLPFVPPYLSAGDNVFRGVSFGSASAGILNSTGDILGQHLALSQQITFFASVRQLIVSKIGAQEAAHLISKSLFYISIGSNDYLENYFLAPGKISPLQHQYSPSAFIELLQSTLENRILELYSLGARKFGLPSLSVLGCLPIELLVRSLRRGKCISYINEQSRAYNVGLLALIQKLQTTYSDAHFVYLNAYDFLNNIINNPSSYGFKNVNTACCGSGPYHALIPCFKKVTSVCQNASEYVFWDFVHPTSAINVIVANKFWAGSAPDVYPMNLKQLAAL